MKSSITLENGKWLITDLKEQWKQNTGAQSKGDNENRDPFNPPKAQSIQGRGPVGGGLREPAHQGTGAPEPLLTSPPQREQIYSKLLPNLFQE